MERFVGQRGSTSIDSTSEDTQGSQDSEIEEVTHQEKTPEFSEVQTENSPAQNNCSSDYRSEGRCRFKFDSNFILKFPFHFFSIQTTILKSKVHLRSRN